MPIDIASGTVFLDYEDVSIPGKVSLIWDRRYSTSLLEKPATSVGLGWTCRYYATLTQTTGEFTFVTPKGATETLADPDGVVARGGVVRGFGAFLEIFRQGERYIVQSWNTETGEIWRYCFKEGPFGTPWKLCSIEDVTGQAVDLIWDRSGRLSSVRQRLEEREILLTYNRSGFVESILLRTPTGERHMVAQFEFDAQGRQLVARDMAGFADRFEYDQQSRITQEIVKDGGVFHYRYDQKGRCVKRSGLDHYDEKRLHYLDAVRITEVTDSYGAITRYQYLPTGQITSEWNPLGAEARTEYDVHGRISARINAVGAVTKYGYDQFGNKAHIANALGHVHERAFNENHQATVLKDPNGQTWTWQYDERNRLLRSVDPLNGTWSFLYDRSGNLVQMSNPLGHNRQFVYVKGMQTQRTDWAHHTTKLEHDGFGRVIGLTDPLGHKHKFGYDLAGNLVTIVRPTGAKLQKAYDSGRNIIRFTDECNRTWIYSYGSCKRMLQSTDPSGNIASYQWGTEPNRLDIIRNEKGEIHQFLYDFAGQCSEEVGFDGRRSHYSYDGAGWCVKTTNGAGEVLEITRDLLGQIVVERMPDGQTIGFEYDSLGNIVRATSPDCIVRMERDALGRLVREVQQTSADEHWVAYTLNAVGEVISTRTDRGLRLDHQLDANSLWVGLQINQGLSIEFKRDANGNEVGRSLPGELQLEQSYDQMNRLVEQRAMRRRGHSQGWFPNLPGESGVVMDRSYSRDASGLTHGIDDRLDGLFQYGFNPSEQLIDSVTTVATERFSYDSSGNITHISVARSGDEVTEDLEYGNGNRLLRKGDVKYEYDEEGRLTRKIEHADRQSPLTWNYAWNIFNQLISLTRSDGLQWRYFYDAFGRRIRKTGPEESMTFIYKGRTPIHEHRVSEQTWTSWLFGPGLFTPLAKMEDDKIFAVFTDHLGTPTVLVDTRDYSAKFCRFLAYGKTVAVPDIPFRFQGQYFDQESGLHYNMFRYYDPETGRFISPDPTGLRGGYNLYSYAPNPVGWIDPWGLCRRGNAATQDHMERVRDQFLAENPGFVLVAGGRDPQTGAHLPEAYLPPLTPGTGTRGSSYVDMTFHNPTTGDMVHVQTVDPRSNSPATNNMSQREFDNAERINQQAPTVPVVTVNKGATPAPGSLNASGLSSSQVNNR